ncbi:MAG: hypothetical protein ACLPJJ_07700 [Acidocella sp.]|uniref:hypothetical protein n=1 Tax=Acidocella sp. TaxID=50710 RepID=UPI003FC432A0
MRAQSSSNSALSLGSGNVAAKTILKAWHGGTTVSRNFYYFFIATPPRTLSHRLKLLNSGVSIA